MTALLILFTLFIILLTYAFKFKDRKPIFGIYAVPGKWYYLKYVVFGALYYYRKYSSKNSAAGNDGRAGQGVKAIADPADMERAQPLSDHAKAFDAIFFISSKSENGKGVYIISGCERRPMGMCNGLFYIGLPGKGLLCSKKIPDTVLFGAEIGEFGAEGIKMTPVEPMKKWNISYKGQMWYQNDPSKFVDVDFTGEWTATTKYFDFDTDLYPATVIRSIAKEKWSREYFELLKTAHQSHYEQFGNLKCKFKIGEESFEYTLPSFRDHSFGHKRDWTLMYRYAFHHIFLEDGTSISVGVICQPSTASVFEAGWIALPNKESYPVKWVDLKLYQHGEGGQAPKDYAFQFKAGDEEYTVQGFHMKMDFDAILEDVGPFGTYQKLVIYLVLLPAVIPCGFHAYAQLFMAADVKHWCRVPELEHVADQDLVKNLSIPLELKNGVLQYSSCTMYNLNYSEIVKSYQNLVDAAANKAPADIIPCTQGWIYDKSIYKSTIVTEWNLVCNKDFYSTLGLVLLAAGGIIGNYIFGYLQDSLGRKPSFFIYLLIECIFGIATAFAQNYIIWIIYRIGVGFTVPAIMTTPYVLAIELVGPRYRTLCTIISNIAYSMGLILLAGVVYLVRDWRPLALATTLPFLCFFLYLWPMPESPRWLLARGQFDKAEAILKTMARINGKSLPANYMVHLHRKYETDKQHHEVKKFKARKYGIMDLFRTPNLRKKTIIITFIWFTNTSVYVGLSYYAPVLGGDEFLNFFLAGVVELPTYLFLWPSMERLGRRWTLCMSMVVGGVACLTTFLVQHEAHVTLALYCVGKMGISSSFVVLPLMASELYPTVVRGLGMSLSSVLGMLGPIFIPLVNYLGSDIMVLPLIIMGALLVAGGIASLLLPETLNQNLPQTLEDGEKMGLDTDFCCHPPVKETVTHELERKNIPTCGACNVLCSCEMINITLETGEKEPEKNDFVILTPKHTE